MVDPQRVGDGAVHLGGVNGAVRVDFHPPTVAVTAPGSAAGKREFRSVISFFPRPKIKAQAEYVVWRGGVILHGNGRGLDGQEALQFCRSRLVAPSFTASARLLGETLTILGDWVWGISRCKFAT